MPFSVDAASRPGILMLRLSGTILSAEMAAFVDEHNRAIDALKGRNYHVFCDIRALSPLSPDAAEHFERAKKYSASRPNFRGSAVLASSALASMQHRRTSESGGVMDTELISADESACWQHLAVVWRDAKG